MSNLKGKIIVILYEDSEHETYENACTVYKELASKGLISVFVTQEKHLQLVENNGYDLRYLFLYDNLPIPLPEQEQSVYHLHNITNPYHYWLDDINRVQEALDYFIKIEDEP